jgi:Terminase large subunit, T4likevirus-type, N-terminal/Terminase RNaseH-like domain
MGSTGRIEHRRIEYDPLPSQKQFHELNVRFKGFSGPIGSGKSQALCQEAIRLSYMNPGRLGLLGAPTYPMLRDATMAALLEVLAANQIPFEHNKGENILVFTDTGSRVLFRPVDEFERLRGTNLAWFGLDELTYTQEESWLRLEGRLRDPKASQLCGFGVWTPKGFDWVYRKFIADPVNGYGVVQAKAFENRHLLAKVEDFYSRLKDSYDEKFYQQEVLGSYVSMQGGRVYSAFDRKEHVRDLKPIPSLPLQWALDFNVDPMSSVIAQTTKDCIHVLDEIVIRQATTSEACEAFQKKFPEHPVGVEVYGDASGNAMQTTGASDFDMVREHFTVHSKTKVTYKVPKANPSVRDRCNLMNRMLKSAAGKVGLMVDPKCKELILDLEQVSYKLDSAVVDKEKDRLRTHSSDALGYLVWQERARGKANGPQGQRLLG